jgi:hypothetical protein
MRKQLENVRFRVLILVSSGLTLFFIAGILCGMGLNKPNLPPSNAPTKAQQNAAAQTIATEEPSLVFIPKMPTRAALSRQRKLKTLTSVRQNFGIPNQNSAAMAIRPQLCLHWKTRSPA